MSNARRRPTGWRGQSQRHSLASKDIKTKTSKNEAMMKREDKFQRENSKVKKPDVNKMDRTQLEKMLISYIGDDSPLIDDIDDAELRERVAGFINDDDLYN